MNHLVQRNAGGAKWAWKNATVMVDSRAAENAAEEHVSLKHPQRERKDSNNGKGFKGPRGEHTKNFEQQVTSVRTPEGFLRKSTVQGALCRISHDPSRKRLVHREE